MADGALQGSSYDSSISANDRVRYSLRIPEKKEITSTAMITELSNFSPAIGRTP